MNRFKQILKTRKGFTLMELIIVLIIVAILAAALIPSFLGFVQRARNESLLGEARVGLNAAQVVMTEQGLMTSTLPADFNTRFLELLQTADGHGGIAADVENPGGFTDITANAMGRIVTLTYRRSTGEGVSLNTDTGDIQYLDPP